MRLERGEKQGKWEGEAPAEPKRQRMATGDWRLAMGKSASAFKAHTSSQRSYLSSSQLRKRFEPTT
jgi:hypothetical protein